MPSTALEELEKLEELEALNSAAYIHVAVGVIRNKAGQVLLARRRQDVHQGGLWEFPGGKVEAGEPVLAALQRELKEELAIDLVHSLPLIQIRHHYSDKSVLLDVWEVDSYCGSPKGNEGQPLAWVAVDQLERGRDCEYPLPAANAAIIKALQLPDALLITGEFDDTEDFLTRLERALRRGIRLVQFRPPGAGTAELDRPSAAGKVTDNVEPRKLLELASALCHQYGARLTINAAAVSALFPVSNDWPAATHRAWTVDAHPLITCGLHLPAPHLMACQHRPSTRGQLLGASCHNQAELQRAADLDVDYVLLSPVKPTQSHPGAAPLGWEHFQSLVRTVNIPVYALGGMSEADVHQARASGAQGIAAITTFWNNP